MKNLLSDIRTFLIELAEFIIQVAHIQFLRFEKGKGIFVVVLYKQRGKMAKRLVHSGMAGLAAVGIAIAPIVAKEFPGRSVDPWNVGSPSAVLSASTDNPVTETKLTDKRGEIIDYTVQEGDTISTVADKFGISGDTIKWQNDLTSDNVKIGQVLEILPVTGVAHKVQKGDTVESIAKKYDASAQAIVDFPFNSFANDETFELAIGQTIFVPDGRKIESGFFAGPIIPRARQITPDAGTVAGSGAFVWPTGGMISQYFSWYHPGVDIANNAIPNVVAADNGRIIFAGWDPSGYGNKIMIDHGNGMRTLYGHLSQIYVVVGQGVNRGDAIGRMGSTGRSTGPHLHFEVSRDGNRFNPLTILQ